MRWLKMLLPLGLCVGAMAQDGATPLQGRLVLWVVRPAAKNWSPENVALATATLGPAGIPRGIQSVNAGDFGTASSNVGQTAGTYGSAPSNVGQNASTYGRNASDHGQTAGSFGSTASSTGTNAGDYGQTAGSYGETVSTLGGAADRRNNRAQYLFPMRTPEWQGVLHAARSAYPSVDVVMYEVREEDLASVLQLTSGTKDAADVLLGTPLDMRWARNGLERMVIRSGTAKSFPPQMVGSLREVRAVQFNPGQEAAVVASAPHMEQARLFALWFADGGCSSCNEAAPKDGGSVALALRAVNAVVKGGSLDGDYDAAAEHVGTGLYAGDGYAVRYAVMQRMGNDVLAAVAVRTAIQGANEVTVLHTLVVVRRPDAKAAWKILQVTPDMTGAMAMEAAAVVGGVSGEGTETKVLAVSVAAPADGGTLGTQPDLWWDNPGSTTTEVVEWKSGMTRGTRLLLIPDADGHVKTRVTAGFARSGVYRWRVWSIGSRGTVAMTDWRTMTVQ